MATEPKTPGRSPMVVALAHDAVEAAIWVDALRDAGIEAVTFEQGVGAALGGSSTSWSKYPVLVSESRLGDARNIIADLGGAAALAPYRDATQQRKDQTRALRAVGLLVLGIVVIAVLTRVLAS